MLVLVAEDDDDNVDHDPVDASSLSEGRCCVPCNQASTFSL